MKGFTGELLGTFVLTLFGCASVACAVLFGEYVSIFQVGMVWGIGVTLAIYLTRYLSCAHLNPAVSVAMVVAGRMKASKLPIYLLAQFLGAILAGFMLYLLFAPSIANYEAVKGIVRGTEASVDTAHLLTRHESLVSSIPILATHPSLLYHCLWRCSQRPSVLSSLLCLSSS